MSGTGLGTGAAMKVVVMMPLIFKVGMRNENISCLLPSDQCFEEDGGMPMISISFPVTVIKIP